MTEHRPNAELMSVRKLLDRIAELTARERKLMQRASVLRAFRPISAPGLVLSVGGQSEAIQIEPDLSRLTR